MHVLKIQRRTKAVGFLSENTQVGGLKAPPMLSRETELSKRGFKTMDGRHKSNNGIVAMLNGDA